MWVQSLAWKNPLEEEIATHSSILVWKIPSGQRRLEAAVHGFRKSQTRLSTHSHCSIPPFQIKQYQFLQLFLEIYD